MYDIYRLLVDFLCLIYVNKPEINKSPFKSCFTVQFDVQMTWIWKSTKSLPPKHLFVNPKPLNNTETPKHQVLQRHIKVGQAGNTMLQQHGRQLFVVETPEDKEFHGTAWGMGSQDGRIRG